MLKPERRNLAAGADRGVGDLLDAVQVTGEAGGDDPPIAVLAEDGPQDGTDTGLARGVTRLLGVRRVAHQQTNAVAGGELTEPTEVGAPPIDRREIELPVARVQDDALRGVHGDRMSVWHRVGDRDELDRERADLDRFVVGHRDHVAATEQTGLLDPVASQPERERCAVDRERLVAQVADAVVVAQQELDPADMVLVTVGCDEARDRRGVVAQVREVGQHEVDPVHVGVGEHQPAIDQHDRAIVTLTLLDRHAVAADLTEPSEKDDPNWGRADAQPRAFTRLA